MSEEFDKWAATQHPNLETLFIQRDESFFDAGYKAATEEMQAKLDAQAAELAALRGYLLEEHRVGGFFSFALKYGLIDTDGKPTPLLTGNKCTRPGCNLSGNCPDCGSSIIDYAGE